MENNLSEGSLSVELIKTIQNIDRIRKQRKITQGMMAEELGVTHQTFQRWTKENYRNIKLRDFISILRFLENHPHLER